MRSAGQHLENARKLYLNRHCERALSEVNKALERRRNYYYAHILKGNILFELDQDELALQCYERAIEILPANYEAYDDKASTLLIMGRAPEAEAFARKSLLLARKRKTRKLNLALVYDTLAKTLLEQNKKNEALRVLREGIRKTQSRILEILLERVLHHKQSRPKSRNSKAKDG